MPSAAGHGFHAKFLFPGRSSPNSRAASCPRTRVRNRPRRCSSGTTRSTKSSSPPGQIREHDGEAVAGVRRQPFLHLVGDRRRRADQGEAGIAAEPLRKLAHREVLACAQARWRARGRSSGVALGDFGQAARRDRTSTRRGRARSRARRWRWRSGRGCRAWRASRAPLRSCRRPPRSTPGRIFMSSRDAAELSMRPFTSA